MRYFVYILQSESNNQFYVGYAEDLKRRLKEHERGNIPSTRNRRPLKFVYYEFCLNKTDATNRERYLKTAWGKRYIKNRIKNYLTGLPHEIGDEKLRKLSYKNIISRGEPL